MTNAEFLNELVPEVTQGIKNAIMTARGVDPAAVYSINQQDVELSIADLYTRMLVMPKFSEGQLSIEYKASSLKEAANRIYLKYGDPNYDSGEPTIRSVKL